MCTSIPPAKQYFIGRFWLIFGLLCTFAFLYFSSVSFLCWINLCDNVYAFSNSIVYSWKAVLLAHSEAILIMWTIFPNEQPICFSIFYYLPICFAISHAKLTISIDNLEFSLFQVKLPNIVWVPHICTLLLINVWTSLHRRIAIKWRNNQLSA